MSATKVLKMIKDNNVRFVDLRFTDTRGKEQHVTLPTREVSSGFFKTGKMFDGSSIAGWKGINDSDMVLMPDASTAVLDPFMDEATLNLRCDIMEPVTMKGYERDPRSLAKRAHAYGKTATFMPKPLVGDNGNGMHVHQSLWKDGIPLFAGDGPAGLS